jgi:transcription elongation GreA/GreB family factor
MTSTQRVWLTPEAHDRLQAELTSLLAPRPTTSPEDPTSANPDSAVDTARRRAARVRELQELLAKAVVGEDPPNDGVAEPGMVLTVRYDDTADEETFLLGLRDVEQSDLDERAGSDDLEVYSPTSPLGTAVTGARPGDQRSYQVPNGTTVRVTLLYAVPYGQHRTGSASRNGSRVTS